MDIANLGIDREGDQHERIKSYFAFYQGQERRELKTTKGASLDREKEIPIYEFFQISNILRKEINRPSVCEESKGGVRFSRCQEFQRKASFLHVFEMPGSERKQVRSIRCRILSFKREGEGDFQVVFVGGQYTSEKRTKK